MKIIQLLVGLALSVAQTPAESAPREDAWNFKVYLDETPIGFHRFTLSETEAGRKLRSEARFDVKFLIIKAYSYAHEAFETWRGDCLTELRARTDDNGETSKVSGQLQGGRFRLTRGPDASDLPACVMSFAYWHPLMLKQQWLLNPQTGEYTQVRIRDQGPEAIPVRGQPMTAQRYRLDAGKFQIDLWYADGARWVGLDSLLDGGRKLRYRIE
jgi:hypothetical protein